MLSLWAVCLAKQLSGLKVVNHSRGASTQLSTARTWLGLACTRKWLEAEHVKKSAGSGYAKYGTKQDSIEGALEELNDMINHYNSICSMQKEKQQE